MRSITFLTTTAAGLALTLGALAGCSGDDPPPIQTPTSEEIRDFFAYNPGSCWRYRFSQGGATLFATATMQGPDDTFVAGETLYSREFRLDSGGFPTVWRLDTETAGQVRLLQSVGGDTQAERETRTYQAMPPIFANIEYAFGTTELEVEAGQRFETTTTPEVCSVSSGECTMDVSEEHEWTVTSTMANVNTPDGDQQAFRWQYRIQTDTETTTRIYNIVPGRGVANFVEADGTQYQVCDWRVCDSAGNCVGAPSCDALSCN